MGRKTAAVLLRRFFFYLVIGVCLWEDKIDESAPAFTGQSAFGAQDYFGSALVTGVDEIIHHATDEFSGSGLQVLASVRTAARIGEKW